MKRNVLLLCCCLCFLGTTYQSKTVTQNWKLNAPAVLETIDPISGVWEVVTPPKLNQPVLSQSIKYADFPKALFKDRDYYDFDVTVRMMVSSENEETQSGGLILRYRNLYSFYMLFLNTKDKRITLTKASLGGLKVLKRENHEFVPDRWYELKANCYLNIMKAYVDGQLLLQAKDETSTGGKVGLVTAGTSKVYFDDLKIDSEVIEVAK